MLQAQESCVKVAVIEAEAPVTIAGLKYAAISVEYNEQDYDSISINTQRAAANVFHTGKI